MLQGKPVDLLLLFGNAPDGLAVPAMANSLGAPTSTVYRHLAFLKDRGLVEERDGEGLYFLGPRVLELARAYTTGLQLPAVAREFMQELVRSTGETCLLTVVYANHATCIEYVESPHPLRLSFERGRPMMLHAGASAKVLLAFMPEGTLEAVAAETGMPAFTAATTTQVDKLRDDLAQIRRQGFAVSAGEVDEGVRAVAVPIIDARGALRAGLTVAGPVDRLTEARVPEVAKQAKETAMAVSRRLYY